MDDNKDKNTNPNQPKKEDIDYLTLKAKEDKAEFGSAGHDDINKNLGSFGNVKVQPEQPVAEVKLDVDAKIVEKASQEKINFERFSKTKRSERAAKTKFGEKVSIMLRTPKGLRTTWVIELLLMCIIIVVSALLIAFLSKYKGATGDGPLANDPTTKALLNVGLIFAWISMFPCIIPLVYLLTSWFIGINQVASSRIFHMMFWICLAISLLAFLIGLGCLINPIHWSIHYPPF